MQVIKSTFSTARVNKVIGQSFAAAAVLLTAENVLNFLAQRPYFHPVFSWIAAGLLWLTTFSFAFSYWFGAAKPIYLRIHALYILSLVILWPLMLAKPLPTDGHFYPWIWWAVDTGWLAAALSFRLRWAIAYFLGMNAIIQFIFWLPIGGSHSVDNLISDSLYTLLTNGIAASIALLLRNAGEKTDQANAEAISSAVLQARSEAEARERERLDALVHDRVLTALISASMASNEAEAKAASELANSAISTLDQMAKPQESGTVFTDDFFSSLIVAGKNLDSQLVANITDAENWRVERSIANALTEATLQALQNSILHAGSKAKRELFLKSTVGHLKIVIRDDGRGFRPSQIPKGRLGIRVSVIGRVEAVGGTVHISSSPGKGATIVLEWSQK